MVGVRERRRVEIPAWGRVQQVRPRPRPAGARPVSVHRRITPRRVLGPVAALLVGGLAGVVLWSVLSRPVHGRTGLSTSPVRAGLGRPSLITTAVAVLIGSLCTVLPGLADARACAPPADATSLQIDTVNAPAVTLRSRLEHVATAAPTGYGLLLARALGADVCYLRNENLYIASLPAGSTAPRGYVLGSVFLTHPRPEDNSFIVLALYEHEARHRTQWAVGTVLGGPLAFPLAYTLDDLFFPDARNHFERLADVHDGHYRLSQPAHPRLGLAEVLAAFLCSALIEAGFAVRRRRQQERLPPFP
ncbi:MAG: hypothetical protein AB7Q92_14260 [Acidimicrobiia bacterium]